MVVVRKGRWKQIFTTQMQFGREILDPEMNQIRKNAQKEIKVYQSKIEYLGKGKRKILTQQRTWDYEAKYST